MPIESEPVGRNSGRKVCVRFRPRPQEQAQKSPYALNYTSRKTPKIFKNIFLRMANVPECKERRF